MLQEELTATTASTWRRPIAAAPEILFHLHIPKTAGTALREALKRALAPGELLEWSPVNPFNLEASTRELTEILARNPSICFVSGHFAYGIHAAVAGRSYKYFTAFRDPATRVLSDVIHNLKFNTRSNPPLETELLLTSESITDYVGHPRMRRYFCNLHCRYISGISVDRFDESIDRLDEIGAAEIAQICAENIERDFVCVVAQEALAHDYTTLFELLSIPVLKLRNENTSGRFNPADILRPETMQRLRMLNEGDYRLLERIFPDRPLWWSRSEGAGSAERYNALLLETYKDALRDLLFHFRALEQSTAEAERIMRRQAKEIKELKSALAMKSDQSVAADRLVD
jgi:hypothetical protein